MNSTNPTNARNVPEGEVLATRQRDTGTRHNGDVNIRVEGGMRPLNPDFHATLRKRLRENGRAIRYLSGMGLDAETIEYFGLGLSAPYTNRKDNQEQADALVYPLRDWSGDFVGKYGYYNIPDVTKNPAGQSAWIAGEPRTYYD